MTAKPHKSIAEQVGDMLDAGAPHRVIVDMIRMLESVLAQDAAYGRQRRFDDDLRRLEDRSRKRNRSAENPRKIRGKPDNELELQIKPARPAAAAQMRGDISKVKEDSDSQGRERLTCGTSADQWPDGYGDQFWQLYPLGRRYDREKVFNKLAKLRAAGIKWGDVIAGLQRFIDSKPEPQFTPAPMVWLNQGRWRADVGVLALQRQKPLSFMDVARSGAGKVIDGNG